MMRYRLVSDPPYLPDIVRVVKFPTQKSGIELDMLAYITLTLNAFTQLPLNSSSSNTYQLSLLNAAPVPLQPGLFTPLISVAA